MNIYQEVNALNQNTTILYLYVLLYYYIQNVYV